MAKLSKRIIESEIQPPATGHCFYRDEDVLGFTVRVTSKSKDGFLSLTYASSALKCARQSSASNYFCIREYKCNSKGTKFGARTNSNTGITNNT